MGDEAVKSVKNNVEQSGWDGFIDSIETRIYHAYDVSKTIVVRVGSAAAAAGLGVASVATLNNYSWMQEQQDQYWYEAQNYVPEGKSSLKAHAWGVLSPAKAERIDGGGIAWWSAWWSAL